MQKNLYLISLNRIQHSSWRLVVLAAACSLGTLSASAQFNLARSENSKYPADKIGRLAKEVRANGWLVLRNDLRDQPKDIASKYKDALGLGADDALMATESATDEVNVTRLRYAQRHKGYPVEGAEFSVYAKGGKALHANGRLVQKFAGAARPGISEAEALGVALASVPARRYQWQDRKQEQELRTWKRDSAATNYPKGQLLYALTVNDGNAANAVHRLAYRFDIMRLEPSAYEAVYVDAVTGRLLRIASLVDPGSCQNNEIDTWYNGLWHVGTWWDSSRNRFQLKDFCRGGYIYTKYTWGTNHTDFANGTYIEAGGSEWNPLFTNWNWNFEAKSAATTHFAVQASHYYFQQVFGRNGMPNYNRDTRVLVGNFRNNSYYYQQNGSDYISIGRWAADDTRTQGDERSMAELDVVAHEFTHGITQSTSGMRSAASETGALSESFSDIFGEMVERYNSPSHDWFQGLRSGTARLFAFEAGNPFMARQASAQIYQGAGWDFFGMSAHVNAGVQNRWFYLLSVGDNNQSYPIPGIGEDKAARIAYRNLTRYLGQYATFADARAGAIQAAIDLYGACSVEVTATTNAWAAVGVGAPAPQFCATEIAGNSLFCVENGRYQYSEFRAYASPGAVKEWTSSNPAFVFSQIGPVDYASLSEVPDYPAQTQLTVRIEYPNNPGATVTKSIIISTLDCYPDPPQCPPGRFCDTPVLERSVTGSGKAKSTAFRFFPNPAQTSVTINLSTPAPQSTSVSVQDMLGRTLSTYQVALGQQQFTVDVARLPLGTYLLTVESPAGVSAQRFQVSR
jgi:bacillolysin